MTHLSSPPQRGNRFSLPVWDAAAPARPTFDRLHGHVEADVLIIGGGVAGMSTALHLAELGIDAVVVEAKQIGSGATGQSGGLIAPDYIRHSPESIKHTLDSDAAEQLTRLVGHSAETCFDLIERHAISCDAHQDGFWAPAHNAALADTQRAYATQWSARGFRVSFVEAEEIQKALGSKRYCGGLRFADGGRLNPLGYVRGLARAACKAGARIFVESPASDVARVDGRWQIRTDGGTVRARRLVLAANGGNAKLHPAMQRTVLPLHVVEFATAPLTPSQRAHILPAGGAFTDKTPYVFSARYDGAGHLISAFPNSFLVRGREAFHKEAQRRLAAHFDHIGAPPIDHIWEGVAWINPSLLPAIYDLGDEAIAIQACNGRGLAINSSIGVELAGALAMGDFQKLSIKLRRPDQIRMHGAAKLVPKALMSLAYLSH